MFRARRYRTHLIFAAVFLLALVQFARHRDGSALNLGIPALVDSPNADPQNLPPPPPPPAAENDAAESHGFTPESPEEKTSESPVDDSINKETPEESKESKESDESSESESSTDSSSSDSDSSKSDSSSSSSLQASHQVTKEDESRFTSHGQGRLEVDFTEHQAQPSWQKPEEHFPLSPEEIIPLPTGKSKGLPQLQATFKDESSVDKMSRLDRLTAIKAEFEHAWNGYKASAMGHDELKPLRGGYRDPFMGWGATLVDSLDTLWIMDLKEEFSIAVDEIKKIKFTTSKRRDIPVFETTIRYLGGLLGAYDVSGHKYEVLLEKAIELAEILIGAFDTPNRMPTLFYHWTPSRTDHPHKADSDAVLAELGSLSVEFTRLAQLTKDNKYYDAIARITNELEALQGQTMIPGLWATRVDASGCRNPKPEVASEVERELPSSIPDVTVEEEKKAMPTDAQSYENFLERRDGGLHTDAEVADYAQMSEEKTNLDSIEQVEKVQKTHPTSEEGCTGGLNNHVSQIQKFSMAALADSTYEYLPKEHMLLGGLNSQYQTMYERAMEVVRDKIVFQPMIKGGRDVRFLAGAKVSDLKSGSDRITYSYEGTHLACFAGGMVAMGSKLFDIKEDMKLAAQLTEGCVWAYESTKTGIMPEHFELLPCEKGQPCEWNETAYRLALDPHAEERNAHESEVKAQKQKEKEQDPPKPGGNSIHAKRDEWHVIAKAQKKAEKSPSRTGLNDDDSDAVARSISDATHEEFVISRIQTEHLPPGMISIPWRKYILRPEAIESVFIMYRLTGDDYWREKGWKMFKAISKYTRTENAHSAIDDVTVDHPTMLDEMESFWLGETLKYFYLLFSDPSLVSLDEFVLNTEAHPLKRPEY